MDKIDLSGPSSSSEDVTGGMAKKVEEAAVIAALGTEVRISLAGSEDGRQALLGEDQEDEEGTGRWKGTLLTSSRLGPSIG